MVAAGSVDSTIEGLVLENVGIELVQQTDFAGGFLDYRPGMRGIVDDVQTSAIFLEFANHVMLNSVEVCSPSLSAASHDSYSACRLHHLS